MAEEKYNKVTDKLHHLPGSVSVRFIDESDGSAILDGLLASIHRVDHGKGKHMIIEAQIVIPNKKESL